MRLNSINKLDKLNTLSTLSTLSKITRWTSRRVILGNAHCIFTLIDTHSALYFTDNKLDKPDKKNPENSQNPETIFLLKLLQAIEKLLNIPPSTELHIFDPKNTNPPPKIQIYFQGAPAELKIVTNPTNTCFYLPAVQHVVNHSLLKKQLWQALNKK